jgi:hypothetical protein
MSVSIRLCAVLAVLGACAVEEPELSTVSAQTGTRCPIFFCGDNAATAGDGLLLDELDIFHRPNYAGVKISFTTLNYGGTPQAGELSIERDEIVVYSGGYRYSGTALIGTVITLQQLETGEVFEILIAGFDKNTQFYRAGDTLETIPVYLLKARRPQKGMYKFDRFVCNHDVLPSDPDWPAVLGHWALAYRGDRYDPDHKKLVDDNNPADGWSFLACAGSGAGKMHLFRHTYAGGFHNGVLEYPTSTNKRTTFMKTVTADYCGTGAPQFTATGNPITFSATPSFYFPPLGAGTPEAIWNENGVVCLSTPRHLRFHDEYSYDRDQIQTICGRSIPKCEAYWPSWQSYGYSATANP